MVLISSPGTQLCPGQELGWILVCPSQLRAFCDHSPQLHRAPWPRGAKSSRIDLRGPWMVFFFLLFAGFIRSSQQIIDYKLDFKFSEKPLEGQLGQCKVTLPDGISY